MTTVRSAAPTIVAVLLLLSGVLFAIAVSVERRTVAETRALSSEGATAGHADEDQGGTESGSTGASTAARAEAALTQNEGGVAFFGIGPESNLAVIAMLVASLLLAAAIWRWRSAPLLVLAVVFGLATATLDWQEIAHQASEGRATLAGLAVVVLALHLGIAIVAAAALLARSGAARHAVGRRLIASPIWRK